MIIRELEDLTLMGSISNLFSRTVQWPNWRNLSNTCSQLNTAKCIFINFLLRSRISSGLIFSFGFYDYFVKIAVCVAVTRKTGTGEIGCAHVRTRKGCDLTTRSQCTRFPATATQVRTARKLSQWTKYPDNIFELYVFCGDFPRSAKFTRAEQRSFSSLETLG